MKVFKWDLDGRKRATSYGEMKWLKIELFRNYWQLFRFTCLSGFWHKGEMQRFFHGIHFCKRRISIQSWMKKTQACFFSEKNELQLQWISIMFARFLNVRIPKCYVAADIFSNKFFFYKFFFWRKKIIIDAEYYVRGKSAHRKWRHWAQEPI